MADKHIVIPLDAKMIALEAFRNYVALIERRIKAEPFEEVRRQHQVLRDKVFSVMRSVESQ